MTFEDKTVERAVTSRPIQVRFERAEPAIITPAVIEETSPAVLDVEGEEVTPAVFEETSPAVLGAPVTVYVVVEVDGHAKHIRVDDEVVAAKWSKTEKLLTEYIDAV